MMVQCAQMVTGERKKKFQKDGGRCVSSNWVEGEEERKGASGRDKASRRRRCLDFERELLRKWHN
jgi:hypothetical protein